MLLYAWYLGLKDGLANPFELTSGITWEDDQGKNEAYDYGVNAGQRIGRIALFWR
jgi:hypothetical protein